MKHMKYVLGSTPSNYRLYCFFHVNNFETVLYLKSKFSILKRSEITNPDLLN